MAVRQPDHDLLDYCTFGLQAVNDEQGTACGKITISSIYQKEDYDIATYKEIT